MSTAVKQRSMPEARLREKAKRCVGCTENFYNANNPMGVKWCWHLASAKLVKRVRIPLSQRPPWTQPPVKVYQCRHEQGCALWSAESVARGNAACRASMSAVLRSPEPAAKPHEAGCGCPECDPDGNACQTCGAPYGEPCSPRVPHPESPR